ncbi:MAG: acyl-CoA thioesterase [Mangrovicoccus sp.]|nr:acyl-CoA thioesterase [Mangrovicoccus sp.]
MTVFPYLSPLDAEALAKRGVPAQWRYGLADRVRFSELDALGHVNNTVYLTWFETLRVNYLRDLGLSKFDGAAPYDLVLKHLECSYHAPTFLDEPYLLTARTVSFRNTSFRMEYAVFAPDCRAEGSAVILLVERESGAKTAIPQEIRQLFMDHDGAKAEA